MTASVFRAETFLIFATFISYTSSLSILTIQRKASILTPATERGWGEWSEWNPCSRTCGGGVTYTRRQCLATRSDSEIDCVGPDKIYSSCNIQDCPNDSVDFRASQCSSHNSKLFAGRTYVWNPYVGEAVLNPCELHCKAENSTFINKLSDKVIDGTRCKPYSYDVCVDGTCQEVGCDMMLGSDLKEDKCLECGGDGSSCFRVSGIFKATNLPTGYVDVIIVPAGATNVEIFDFKTRQNFLAVRRSSGEYLINGNRRIGSSRAHRAAGTTFHYRRKLGRRRAPESLRALGPTTEEIFIQLYVQERNRGIRYRFYLPRDAKNRNKLDVEWVPSNWSKCSRVCGGGIQHRRVNCLKSNVTVQPYLCHFIQRPIKKQRCNLEPCVARWQTSNWTECSATCSGGVRFRQVYCTESSAVFESSMRRVHDEKCRREDRSTRPSQRENCNEIPCSGWMAGNWSSCSVSCGVGNQSRSVVCLSSATCSSDPPERVRSCNLGPCTGLSWVVTAWSQCTEPCGNGIQSRVVRCASERGGMYEESLCRGMPRPASNQSCRSASGCSETFAWMTGSWSKCSAECGFGMQTRKVACSIFDQIGHRMVQDNRCSGFGPKPAAKRECKMPNCEAVWFKGPWQVCSRTCGGGKRIRFVTCLSDIPLGRDVVCNESKRPASEEVCNIQPCPTSIRTFSASAATVGSRPFNSECDITIYGCCPDRKTPAQGWLLEGCPEVNSDESLKRSCHKTTYGCCNDNVQVAQGPNHLGCPEYGFCFAPADRGRFCNEWLPRYYFDPVDVQCKHFWFGGCAGNENNYISMEDCQVKCSNSSGRSDDAVSSTAVKTTIISRLPPDFSPTYSPPTVSESTFDTTSFTAASSALTTTQSPRVSQTLLLPAVAANASTLWLGSKARSLSLQDCSLPPDRGPCFRRLHRWYFDAVDHSCKTFIFSGCAANVNNFETRDQCMSACYREEHVNVEHDREFTKCELDQTLAEFEEKIPPQCDPRSGKYRPLQCISDINGVTISCWCVDPESGVEIDRSRRYGLIAPDCSSPIQAPSPSSPCVRSRYGCCPDGVTPAFGAGSRGCAVSLRIKSGRSVIYTRPGSSASLPCPAVGYPMPRVKWYKDGEEVSTTDSASRVIQNGYNLIFTSVQPRHLGSYVCEASNGVNLKQRKTVRLTITEDKLDFRTKPSNLTVKLGSKSHFRCRIKSGRASISWYKDGLLLKSSTRVNIKPWGDLRIDKTLAADQGIYTCVAKSSTERISSFAFLSILSTSNNEYMRPSMRTLTTLSQSSTAFECEDYPDLADCHLVATAED